ncbi:hypothetical protein DFP72DRAFT_51541 [Ephemerocybe angulata]|uniref:MYND-type domain-containing protein n=1 Tax=Ephemerocybe angulata TaxID=980116 RepID=A0A8H6LYN2_9AGAR|nr:hypothetical protein DFP72DRAFT_51541 [Tulosesus angulatus]
MDPYLYYSFKWRQEVEVQERNLRALAKKPYTAKTVEVLLEQLRVDDIPNLNYSNEPHWPFKTAAALYALNGLNLVAHRCIDPASAISPSAKQATINRLLTSFDLIEGWAAYFASPAALTNPGRTESRNAFPQEMARHLLVLLNLDPSILQRFCSSTTSIDLALRIWTLTGGKGRDKSPYANIESESDGGCAIVRLMLHCVQKGGGLAAFIDRIGSREVGFPRRVALLTIQRLNAARWALEGRGRTKETVRAALVYLRDVIRIVDRLVADPLMQRAFEHHDYARKLAETLQGFVQALQALDPRQYANDLGICVTVMMRAILFRAQSNQPRNLALALEHGLMDTLISVLKVCQAWQEGPRNLAICISGLESYLPWPAVLGQLRPYYTSKTLLEAEKTAGHISEFLGRRWRIFNVALWEHFQAHDLWDRKVRLCDNLECQRAINRGDMAACPPISRECSGCSAFVYCGELCQREDWDARHSTECTSARIDSITRKAAPGAWYSPHQRAYHVAIIEYRFNCLLARCADPYVITRAYEAGTMTPPTFGAIALALLEQGGIKKSSRFFHLKASSVYGSEGPFLEIKQGQYPLRPLPCATELGYLQPRMDEYLKESGALKGEVELGNAAQEEDRRTVKYVECTFKLSESTEVHVMVKMRLHWDERRGVGRFLSVASMARFGGVQSDCGRQCT